MSYVKPDVSGRIYHNRLNFVNRYFQPSLDNVGYNVSLSPSQINVPRTRSISPLNEQLPPISPEKLLPPLSNNTKDIPSFDSGYYNIQPNAQPNLGSNIIFNPKYPDNSYRDLMVKQLFNFNRSPELKINLEPINVNSGEINPVPYDPILTKPNYVWIPQEKNEEPIKIQTIGIPRRRRIIDYDPEMRKTSNSFYTPNNRHLSSSNINFLKVNFISQINHFIFQEKRDQYRGIIDLQVIIQEDLLI